MTYHMEVFTGLMGFIGGLLAIIGGYIASKLGHMTDSVDLLNVKLAVVIEKLEHHDKRISKLEGG